MNIFIRQTRQRERQKRLYTQRKVKNTTIKLQMHDIAVCNFCALADVVVLCSLYRVSSECHCASRVAVCVEMLLSVLQVIACLVSTKMMSTFSCLSC